MNLKQKKRYSTGGKIDPNVVGQGLNLGFNSAASLIDTFSKDQTDRINVESQTAQGALRMAGQGASLGMTIGGPIGGAIGSAAGLVIGGVGSYLNADKQANENAKRLKEQYYGKDTENMNFSYAGDSKFAYGGSLPTKIEGNTHELGGVPLGNSGGEIEDGEVVYKGFVFSNRIPYDSNKKLSYADQATKIMKKYKERSGDTYSTKSMNNELERLKASHQQALAQMEQQTYTDDEQDVKDVYEFGGYIMPKDGRYDNFTDPEIKNKFIEVAKQRGMNINKLSKRVHTNKMKYADGGPIVNGVDYSYLLKPNYKDQGFNGQPNLMDLRTNQNVPSYIGEPEFSKLNRQDDLGFSMNRYNLDKGIPTKNTIGTFDTNNIQNFGDNSSNYGNDFSQFDPKKIPSYQERRVPITSFLGSHSNEYGNETIGFPDGRSYGNQDSMKNNIGNFDKTSSNYGDFSQFNDPNLPSTMNYGFISNPLNYNLGSNGSTSNDLPPLNPSTTQPNIIDSRGSMGQSGLFSNKFPSRQTSPNNNNRFGREESALIASSIAGVDNIIKGLKPENSKLKRVKFDRLNLDDIRRLNRVNADRQSNQFGRAIRGSGRSTGEILSGLSATNSSIARDRMNTDANSYIQEKQTNLQIGNQESSANNSIANQEYLNNEQNRATAKSTTNFGLSNLGNNFQGYTRDKAMRSENLRYNEQVKSMINETFPNFKWGENPESDKMVLQYINRLSTGK